MITGRLRRIRIMPPDWIVLVSDAFFHLTVFGFRQKTFGAEVFYYRNGQAIAAFPFKLR